MGMRAIEQHKEREHTGEKKRRGVTKGHTVSDKTLLDLFVLLGSSDESHLLWLTEWGVHIKAEPWKRQMSLFYNEQEAGTLVETLKPNKYTAALLKKAH